MKFLDNRDYISYATIAFCAVVFGLLGGDLFSGSLMPAFFGGIGALVGYGLSLVLFNKSTILRLLPFLLVSILLVIVLSITGNSNDMPEQFKGEWQTNDDDGLTIKMRFSTEDSVYLSMSPEYEEVGYIPEYHPEKKVLTLKRNGNAKFSWEVGDLKDESFILKQGNETLQFYREN